MRNLKKGDIIQISRRGYFIVDKAYDGESLVLFNIPEGNKRESPTSYMSLTNQKLASIQFVEEAEQKGKPDSKESKAPSAGFVITPEVEDLDKRIRKQGDTVRELKTNKAPKVIINESNLFFLSFIFLG